MSLENRIMGQLPDILTDGAHEYYNGFSEASGKAANLAKEADELMEEMESCLEQMWKDADSPWAEIAGATLVKFDKYKDQAK